MTKLVDHGTEIVIICLRPTRSSGVTMFQIIFFPVWLFLFFPEVIILIIHSNSMFCNKLWPSDSYLDFLYTYAKASAWT